MPPKLSDQKQRFLAKFTVVGTCWVWSGYIDKTGYGQFAIKGPSGWNMEWAHRISFEMFRGQIPGGLQIDHVCRNRSCVNPDHLDAVTQRENILRGSSPSAKAAQRNTCINGHEYTPETTRIARDGSRQCRTCQREWRIKNHAHCMEMQRARRSRVESIETAQETPASEKEQPCQPQTT